MDTTFEWKKRVLDLGSYEEISLEEAVSLKLNTLVLDEVNLNRPLSISLIIPTKIDVENEEMRKLELKVLGGVLSECSKLVDLGYLDEIIVIDGSKNGQGKPSYTVLERVVETAYKELGLFKEQIKLLTNYTSERIKAKKGFFDFVLKVVNQFDENMGKVLAKYGAFNVAGRFGVPPGKGSGVWLSVPIASGDIICFVDSDIKDFKKEFVVGLCYPIIYTKTIRDSAIKYVKAYYQRLTTRLEQDNNIKLGGRVSRLLVRPLMKVIVENFNVCEGVETFKYPLSGEAALSREILEIMRIPYHYGIEISSLLQLCDMVGIIPLAQVDLGLFQHIGQSSAGILKMSEQIIITINDQLRSHDIELSQEDILEKILSQYKITANEMLEADMSIAEAHQKEIEESANQSFVFSIEEEREKINSYIELIRTTLTKTGLEGKGEIILYLPPWQMIEKETNAYFQIREMLKRRSIQSTWSRINSIGLI